MADEAIESTAIDGLQGKELMGRPLRINKAEPRGSGGSRRGGRGGYVATVVAIMVATVVAIMVATVVVQWWYGGGNGGGNNGGGNNGGYGGGYGGG